MTDREYMELAISLAKKGVGHVNPNPLVGAVIVKDGKIIGQGYHEQCGSLHAERNAIKDCKEKGNNMEGATIYVTLTPCCHYGKTPPCTEAIIENKMAKVVIGSRDPNPLVGEKSIGILRDAGIEVVQDFMKEECDDLNPVFFHYISTKTPYIVMKFAETLDGKIAAYTGKSQWITGEASRKRVHQSRNQYTGIMVGVNTVLKDNPMLNCRIEGGRNPIRIVCDTNLRTPLDSNLVNTAKDIPLIIATAVNEEERLLPYKEKNVEILNIGKDADGHIDLKELSKKLGEKTIDSILLEGGGSLNWSAMKAGIVNKVEAYIAPKLLGGKEALSPISGLGFPSPDEGILLDNIKVTTIDNDILIEGEVKKCSQE